MLLGANTMNNLEIFQNETDHSRRGSLFEILDQTKTSFGSRLLKNWVSKPLIDKKVLTERIDAIEEIITSEHHHLNTLYSVLRKLPDLERGLCHIQYGQCSPQELAILLVAFRKVSSAFEPFGQPADVGLNSPLLCSIIYSIPLIKERIDEIVNCISLQEAAEGCLVSPRVQSLSVHRTDVVQENIWRDPSKYPDVLDNIEVLQCVDGEMQDELKAIRKLLRMPSLQWTTVATEEVR
jgi:DNA mismatch repair protein MSH3